jgi:hypothetical protein
LGRRGEKEGGGEGREGRRGKREKGEERREGRGREKRGGGRREKESSLASSKSSTSPGLTSPFAAGYKKKWLDFLAERRLMQPW